MVIDGSLAMSRNGMGSLCLASHLGPLFTSLLHICTCFALGLSYVVCDIVMVYLLKNRRTCSTTLRHSVTLLPVWDMSAGVTWCTAISVVFPVGCCMVCGLSLTAQFITVYSYSLCLGVLRDM